MHDWGRTYSSYVKDFQCDNKFLPIVAHPAFSWDYKRYLRANKQDSSLHSTFLHLCLMLSCEEQCRFHDSASGETSKKNKICILLIMYRSRDDVNVQCTVCSCTECRSCDSHMTYCVTRHVTSRTSTDQLLVHLHSMPASHLFVCSSCHNNF